MKLKSSMAALAVAMAFSAPVGATDIFDARNDALADPVQAQVNWTGFFAGGQFGYGIASQRVTTLSTEHFDAVPSRCWAEADASIPDYPNPNPADDRTHDIDAFGGISITNVTENECESLTSGYASGSGPIGSPPVGSYSYETGFDPAVDAHDVTTKTVFDGSDSGLIGGFQLGFDKQMGRVVAGVFGDYNWSDISAKNNDWTIGGRIGFLIDPRMMVYGLAGYTQADYDEADYEGWTAGVGAEYALTDNIFLGGKYTYTDLGEETLADTPTLNIVSERDEHKILMDLKIKLNSF